MIHISHRAYLPGSWAGGTTSGIWADPTDAISAPAAAGCWVGTAVIERNAPYSFFAGRHRLHLPIHGEGLRLHFRDPAHEVVLGRGQQYQFDGERPVAATPLNGPVVAFNLIYRADSVAAATVTIVGPDGLVWPPTLPGERGMSGARLPVRIVYSIAGTLAISAGDNQRVTLTSDDTLVVVPSGHEDASPQLLLTATSAAPAEVILATLWLNANPQPLSGSRPEGD